MVKGVLFDMDGVLIDTEWFYNRRRVAYLETQGFTFDEIPDLSGSNDDAIWEFYVPDDPARRQELQSGYRVYAEENPLPYDELLNRDARPVLAHLRELGIKTAIASSSPMDAIEDFVAVADIANILDLVLSGHDCKAFKPDPEIYLRALDVLGLLPNEAIVVEDSPLGIEAGVRSGCRVLALRPHEGVHLDQSQAHRVIDSLFDVLDEIDS